MEGVAHALLIEAKLCCGDGLALGDLRGVELKLFVVTPLWRQLPVVLYCGVETHTNKERHNISHKDKGRGRDNTQRQARKCVIKALHNTDI